MERPNEIQFVERGKLFCSGVFKTIVETWNWLVSSYDNLRGDYDVNPLMGFISVDKSKSDHPIIKLMRLPEGLNPGEGGGGGGGGASATAKGNTDDSVEITLSGANLTTGSDSNVKIATKMVGETPTVAIDVYYV